MAYAIHYDEGSGLILAIADSAYASSGDWIVTDFPPEFSIEAYYIYELVTAQVFRRYYVNRETGFAYDSTGERIYTGQDLEQAVQHDPSHGEGTPISNDSGNGSSEGLVGRSGNTYDSLLPPPSELMRELETTVTDVSVTLEDRSFVLKYDGGYVLNATGSGIDDTVDRDSAEAAIDSALSRIDKYGVFCAIFLDPGEAWAWDGDGQRWIQTIPHQGITKNTVVNVLGINREVLQSDLVWAGEDDPGKIVFRTYGGGAFLPPSDQIQIFCWLTKTDDDWSASGKIEAWPAKDLVSKRYRHKLHYATDSITISSDGVMESPRTYGEDEPFPIPAGGTANVQTSLDFSGATLLFATPEWTGNTHVIMPHCYVASNRMLCYTLTNLGSQAVYISEVMIRLMYRGRVDNLVSDLYDTAQLSGYITNEDINELTG